jgi:hypothetical protein
VGCGEFPELAETAPVAPPLARFGKIGRSASKQRVSLILKQVAKSPGKTMNDYFVTQPMWMRGVSPYCGTVPVVTPSDD